MRGRGRRLDDSAVESDGDDDMRIAVERSVRETHAANTPELAARMHRSKQANHLCPCGSGIKYKRCCSARLDENETRRRRELMAAAAMSRMASTRAGGAGGATGLQ